MARTWWRTAVTAMAASMMVLVGVAASSTAARRHTQQARWRGSKPLGCAVAALPLAAEVRDGYVRTKFTTT